MNKIRKNNIMSMIGMFLLLSILSCNQTDRITTIIPKANFEVKSEKFQAEQKISFTDLSTDKDGFITAWKWDFGDFKTSTEHSPNHYYAIGGNYIVKLIVADNTGSFSEAYSTTVEIANDPLANIKAPTTVWSYDLSGLIKHSSPAVSDNGTVFIGFNQATREDRGPDFIAVKDGSKVWEQIFEEGSANKSDEVRSSPAIGSNGKVYTSSYYSRKTFVLNATSGTIEGEINLDARVRYTSPTFAANGNVYIAGYSKGGRGFHSLNSSLSTKDWVFKSGSEFNATPAIGADGTIYIGSNDDNFYAINPDGSQKWSTEYGSWTGCATAIGSDGTVYFSGETSSGGVLIAYNPADGTEKWRKVLPNKAGLGGPAVAADGTIYLGGHEEKMIAYNTDGTEKWRYTAKGAIETVPAIDNDGNIYFGDLAGFFHVVNPDGLNTWKVIKLGDAINSSAAIGSDGVIYVAANEGSIGKIYALRTNATGLQTGGWPMFAKDAKHTGR